MATTPSPFVDHAAPILAGDPVLSDENRADLWDIFHQSKNPAELAAQLAPLAIPDDTKHRLYEAKISSVPSVVEPLDKASAIITHIAQLPPAALDIAETHPNVLKTVAALMNATEKGAGKPAEMTSPTDGGSTPDKAESPALPALPPRPDGLEHYPPIPDGHKRVLASDGGVHDIPAENVPKAFEIDPRLQVLNA